MRRVLLSSPRAMSTGVAVRQLPRGSRERRVAVCRGRPDAAAGRQTGGDFPLETPRAAAQGLSAAGADPSASEASWGRWWFSMGRYEEMKTLRCLCTGKEPPLPCCSLNAAGRPPPPSASHSSCLGQMQFNTSHLIYLASYRLTLVSYFFKYQAVLNLRIKNVFPGI